MLNTKVFCVDMACRAAYMADVELDACQSNCDELDCKCFDWSNNNPGEREIPRLPDWG